MQAALTQLCDQTAKELMTADIDDLQDLGALYSSFERMSSAIEALPASDQCDAAADMVGHALGLLKDTMLAQDQDRSVVATELSNLLTRLQQLVFTGTVDAVGADATCSAYQLPEFVDEDIFNEFLEDQPSVLDRLETLLLELEQGPDAEKIAEMRRIFHTLKGEAGIFQLTDVEHTCHRIEDMISDGADALPLDMLLGVKDWLVRAFDALGRRELPSPPEALLFEAQTAPPASPAPPPVAAPASEPVPPVTASASAAPAQLSGDLDLLGDFVSEVKEHIDTIDNRLLSLEQNPEDQDLLNAVFRVFHTVKGAAGFLALDDMARLAHNTESLLDRARKSAIVLSGVSLDLVFEAVDLMKSLVTGIEQALTGGTLITGADLNLDDFITRLSRQLDEGDAVEPVVPESLAAEPVVPETLAAEPVDTPAVAAPAAEQPPPTAEQQAAGTVRLRESIKVDSDNLDKLIDAIGELVIIESMIRQDSTLRQGASSNLLRNLTQMDKITRELQQLGMSLRMIPVRATFQKMARIVRDLAKKSGKQVAFELHGEDTMLDKSIVDRIGDPLIHLVRNSVDHGIETAVQERIAAGKPERGTVRLNAFHKGGNINIEIRDDGRGLDREAIMAKARQRGLIGEHEVLTDREVFELIFHAGFSTAKQITDVSGRGVGMDVVKRAIEDLRGSIGIESEAGKGTCFTLRLPLTLAIIDGMLVCIGDERYIIPTLSIVESLRPAAEDVVTVIKKGEMVRIREDLIPLFRLADLFQVRGAKTDPTQAIIIVVEDNGKRTGLLVDDLLGQQSTVIKSLGASLRGLPGVAGGSILSDGTVGIILDVGSLVKLANGTDRRQQTESDA